MSKVKLVFAFTIIILSYVKYSVSLQYVPPDRELEVVQAASYRIGVEDAVDLEISKCHFTSDTGLNCTFEIWPIRASDNAEPIYCNYNGDAHTYEFENTVTEYGQEGLCQITVGMVQSTGPTNWTLIAEDFNKQVVVNNTFKVHFFYKADLLEYGMRLLEFSSFVNHMTGFAYDDLVSCNVVFNNTKIELDLHSTRTKNYLAPYSEETEEITERLSSLGVGLCGFKYVNATNNIQALQWMLTATNKEGMNYRQNFTTRINGVLSPGNPHSRKEAYWGTSVVVSCYYDKVGFFTMCSIFNPSGELVESTQCQHTITSFSMNDVGVWKCYVGTETAMESTKFTVEFVGKNAETIVTWNYETESYLSMGCKTANVTASEEYCKMIAPNQRLFILEPHLATDRYLSLGTDKKNGVCSFQIKKPLQEFEKGRWLCEIKISSQDLTGGVIIVGEAQAAVYPKYIKLTTQLDESFKINCVVPYFTEYCRIQAPNGTKYHTLSDNQIRLGTCSMAVNTVTASDNGTWVCLFGRDTGEPDDEIIVEVTVAELLQHYKFVEVDPEDSAELMCSSGGLPLRYCRFIAPNGKGYQILSNKNSTTISYHGRGLEYGDCGIKISKTTITDNGYWSCVTEIISDKKHNEISARIMLRVIEIGPNFAAIGIGTAVGVILVGSIFGMVVIRKWRRRRHDEFPGASTAERGVNTDGTLSRHSSESNIFNMEAVPHSSSTNPRNDRTVELEHPL